LPIRTATLADAILLSELASTTMREAFGPPYNTTELVEEYIQSSISPAILEDELADPNSIFFIVELVDKTPVGYAKLRRKKPPRQMTSVLRRIGKAIEIQRIYLLQTQVGQGQGRLLMEYCLNWARQTGYTAVWLGVWERNERALAFYQKMGFERIGFHYFQFGSERQRDFWLQKQL
jgi:ribosomal protein S18 acetylase RimI-like enzyme